MNVKGYTAQIEKFDGIEGRVWHTVRLGNYTSSDMAKKDADILNSEDHIP